MLERDIYIEKLETLLKDNSKFVILNEDPTIKREGKLTRFLLNLKKSNKISENLYQRIRPSGSQPARLYGLPKIHKQNYPLRPVYSSINSFNYNLSKELARMISPFIKSEYTIKNTFTFVKEVWDEKFKTSVLASFDVSSFITSIPLNETIEITLNYVFKDNTTFQGMAKN